MWRFALVVLVAAITAATSAPVQPVYAAPPPNDNFALAEFITQASLPVTRSLDNTDATMEGNEPSVIGTLPCPGGSFGNSVWYRFTPTSRMQLRVSTAASTINSYISVYSGNSAPSVVPITCNNDFNGTIQSQVSFTAEVGTTYRLQIMGYDDNGPDNFAGVVVTTFAVDSLPPDHDNFSAAAVSVLSSTDNSVTTNASSETGEPLPLALDCGIGSTGVSGKTVWYTFLAPTTSTQLRVSTTGSSFNTFIAVYTGNALTALTRVACNNDVDGTTQSRVSFTAQAARRIASRSAASATADPSAAT